LPEPFDRRREEHRARPTLRGRARALRTFLAHIQDHHVSMAGPDRPSTLTGSRDSEHRELAPRREARTSGRAGCRAFRDGRQTADGKPDGTGARGFRHPCATRPFPKWLPNRDGKPHGTLSLVVSQARRRRFPGSGLPVRSARAAGFRSGACGAEVTARVRSGTPRGVGSRTSLLRTTGPAWSPAR